MELGKRVLDSLRNYMLPIRCSRRQTAKPSPVFEKVSTGSAAVRLRARDGNVGSRQFNLREIRSVFPDGQDVSLALAAASGSVLGWARHQSGGLKAPIRLHTGTNGALTAVVLTTSACLVSARFFCVL